ncbi:hypothetical protein C2E23DRAFT_844306 [Lenzites betulinus]|nr:hypothetical protein C2E23DRAFT_844306 [Lenzites betulinus]
MLYFVPTKASIRRRSPFDAKGKLDKSRISGPRVPQWPVRQYQSAACAAASMRLISLNDARGQERIVRGALAHL